MANTELSEFFSLVSQEKNQNRTLLKKRIENPKSDLGSLFRELENAHKETKNVSEELIEEKNLTEDDQNKLEVFSNLMNSFDSAKEIPQEVLIEADPKLADPETIIVDVETELKDILEDIPEEIVKTDNIIQNIVTTLDDMGERTEVKEEIDQITSLRKEFEKFKNHIQQHISKQDMSGAGSGETRLEFLDDVDRDTAKVNDKALVYDSTSGKWKGETFLTGALTDLDIDGGTDIGAALADADLFIVDDGAGGTNRKTAASRIKTYVSDVTLTTAAQTNITSLGTLTALTVDNIVINGTNIGHTSDTDALAIDSSGNVTASQNLTVSGDLTVTGTTKTVDTVTMEAANAVIFEGSTADGNETTLTIIDPTADHTQRLINQSGYIPLLAATTTTTITSTPEELNILDGATVVVGEINALDLGNTAVGTAIASKAVILDSNKDYTGVRNFTLSGELDAGSLDVSGDADIDGTLEADAITVDGTTLAEFISDTVGAMVGSNTETDITVTYQDSDNTIDFVVGTLNQDTTGTAAIATTVTITDNESTDEDNAIIFGAGGDVDGGNLGLESDGTLTYNPSTGKVTATGFVGTLTGNVTGNTSGTAATVTTAAQTNITSLGTLTTLTVDNIIINGTNIGHTSDTDAIAIASDGVVTFSQNPVFPDGGVAIVDLDIDGGTDIGAALADADLLIVDDGAGGTNRKTTMARVKTYINAIDDATAMAIALG